MSARKDSIQLLRIILFFMVVGIHVSTPYLTSHTTVFVLNWQVANFIDGFSRVAVNTFVIITGYFYFKFDSGKIHKQIKKLLVPIAFYVPLTFILYAMDGEWNFVRAVFEMLKCGVYFYHFWYIEVLVVFLFFAAYVNVLLHALNKKQAAKLIAALLLVFSIIPTVQYVVGYDVFDLPLFSSRLSLFITLYAIGAFIGRYEAELTFIDKFQPLMLFFISQFVVVFGSVLINSRFSPYVPIKRLLGVQLVYPFPGFIGTFFAYENIFVILASVSLFLFTTKVVIHSKFINGIASCTYGAYLNHVFFITLFAKIDTINPFLKFDSPYYVAYIGCFMVLVGVASIATEWVRQKAAQGTLLIHTSASKAFKV